MPVPWFLRPRTRKRPTALVLGGGGARGMAHVGVLEVLERHGMLPDLIVGTSIGAVIGAMYARNPDAAALRERVLAFINGQFFESVGLRSFYQERADDLQAYIEDWMQGLRHRLNLTRAITQQGMIPQSVLMDGLSRLLDEGDITDCRIRFACLAVELRSGETRILDSGPLRQAVAASSSIPGVLEPASRDGDLLVDGAVTSTTPVRAARALGARSVVAVDVSKDAAMEDAPEKGYEVMLRAGEISSTYCNALQLEEADCLLRLPVEQYHWARFEKSEELIRIGRSHTELYIERLTPFFPKQSRSR